MFKLQIAGVISGYLFVFCINKLYLHRYISWDLFINNHQFNRLWI